MSNKSILTLSSLFWLISIFSFLAMLYMKVDYPEWNTAELFLLSLVVIMGFIAFFFTSKTIANKIFEEHKGKKAYFMSTILIGIVLINFFLFIIVPFLLFPTLKGSYEDKTKKITKTVKYKLIKKGIKIGSSGDEVKIIQSALATDKSFYPSGIISGYFGQMTKDAVIKFQSKFDLEQNGELDSPTAEKFNEIYGDRSEDYYLEKVISKPTTSINTNVNTSFNNEVDPVINCNVYVNCGGGTRQLKRSICEQSTCCQIGNTWLFYESKIKCTQDQNSYSIQNRNTNSYPTYAPVPTWAPLPTWEPLPTYPPIPTFEPYVYVAPTKDPEQCKSDIINQGYDDTTIQVQCNIRFGASSGAEACITIKKQERDRLIAGCGS